MIKNIRDFKSCLNDITGSTTTRDDQKDILRYNHSKQDYEYNQGRKQTAKQVTQHQAKNNVWGEQEKPRYKSARRMNQTTTYKSQIVFGQDTERYVSELGLLLYSKQIYLCLNFLDLE